MNDTCFGCRHQTTRADAAGGGIYGCALCPGPVLGAWGHWIDESDVPRPSKDCKERKEESA